MFRPLSSACALALAAFACIAHGEAPAPAAAPQPAPSAAINPEVIRVLVSAEGETTLVAPMTGRIRDLRVSLGSGFRKGDVVLAFDCSEQAARLKIADAELKGSRENYDAKVRLRSLQAAGETEVNLAAAAVDKSLAQVELARVEMQQCNVLAPFGGRVANLHVKQYQGVTLGTPLADIISTGPLKARLNVPSRWLKTLKTGTPFKITVDETGHTYPARVSAISARVDAAAQTIAIEGRFTSAFRELLPGMSGTAQFDGYK